MKQKFSCADRHPASTALIALREALGLSQQRLAVEVLHLSISTVARWESFEPPTGTMLLHLADIARSNGLNEIAATFVQIYMSQLLPALGDFAGMVIDTGFLATLHRVRGQENQAARGLKRKSA